MRSDSDLILQVEAVHDALRDVFARVDYDIFKLLENSEAYGEDSGIDFDSVTLRFIQAYNTALAGRLNPPR